MQCFFPRKRLLYQVFNFTWRAENNIQPTRLKFSIYPGFTVEGVGHVLTNSAPKAADKLTAV